MRGTLIAGALIGGTLLGAFAPPATSLDLWKTGDGILSYNHLRGDCQTLTHSFGRNAAWGLWVMPLAEVEVSVAPAPEAGADGDGGARMTFTCRAGAACIKAGAYRTTDGRLPSHGLSFGSTARAAVFETAIADLRRACAAPPGA